MLPLASQPSGAAYIEWPADAGGAGLTLLKAVTFRQSERRGGPLVFWEPRTVVASFRLPGYDAQLSKWLDRRMASSEVAKFVFTFLGCDRLGYRPSLRSAMTRKFEPGRLQWCKAEELMSSTVFLGVLLVLPKVLRKGHRPAATNILSHVLAAWLP